MCLKLWWRQGRLWLVVLYTLCFPGQRTCVPVQSPLNRTCCWVPRGSPGKQLHSDTVHQAGPAKAKQGAKEKWCLVQHLRVSTS